MVEQRSSPPKFETIAKYAILMAATILAARRLNEIGSRPCPARECAVIDAIGKAGHIPESLMSAGRAIAFPLESEDR